MCPDRSFLCVRHVLASFITNQQRNLALWSISLITAYSHLFHVKTHTHFSLLLYHLQQHCFYTYYFFYCFVLFTFYVEMEVFNIHGADGLAVKSFDVFYLLTYSFSLYYSFLDLQVAKQRLFTEFFASLLENSHTCVLLPGLEVFFPGIQPKIIDSIEIIEDPLLL